MNLLCPSPAAADPSRCRGRGVRRLQNHLAVSDDHHWSAGRGVVLFGVVNAERTIERRCDIVGGVTFMFRHASGFVAFAQHLAALDAATGEQHKHVARIVISAVAFLINLRCPSKLSGHKHDRGFQQTAISKPVNRPEIAASKAGSWRDFSVFQLSL